MRVYDTQVWKRVRRAVLADNPLCVMCQRIGVAHPATDVDHITPIEKGGAWYDPDNLQPLCHEHHSIKTLGDKGHPVRWGATQDGLPLQPDHPWNR